MIRVVPRRLRYRRKHQEWRRLVRIPDRQWQTEIAERSRRNLPTNRGSGPNGTA